jgi:hypothetical protein
VCVADITAKDFIEQRGSLRSRYELLVDFLSEMLSVGIDDINVFSLTDVRERTLDVRFAVHSSPFLRAERLQGYLAAHKQKVLCNDDPGCYPVGYTVDFL